jgi:hypothetical protein
MKWILKRIARKKGYTIGKLYLRPPREGAGRREQDDRYICDTMEPQWRDLKHGEEKVNGETAIPEGTYAVAITRSEHFHEYLPIVLGVPHFSGIRIHAGNSPADTRGCILVGENKQKGRLLNSREALLIIKSLSNSRAEGEGIKIEIQ